MQDRLSAFGVAVLAAGFSLGASAPSAAAPSFTGLGDLPGGAFESYAFDVSADGQVVVGYSASDSDHEAFRWTATGGMQGLGDLPGGTYRSWALGVSPDGSVIVGHGQSTSGREPFRWTSTDGMVGLGFLDPSHPTGFARDVSGDNSVITGASETPTGDKAFRWTASSGVQGLGDDGPYRSLASRISVDGSTIVGQRDSALFPTGEPYRWTLQHGFIGLGSPGLASAVSSDGSVIAGSLSHGFDDYEAFRWTEGGGIVSLGYLLDHAFSTAHGMSANGSILVGVSGLDTDPDQTAFIWDETNGMRDLKSVLVVDLGLDLTDWTLRQAWAISADGLTIVGVGENPDGNREAWIATIPEPSAAPLVGLGLLAIAAGRRCRAGNT